MLLSEVKKYNAKLSALLDHNRATGEIDAFFDRLFSPEWLEDHAAAQDALLQLFEKDRTAIHLKPYVRMLRVAQDCLHLFKNTTGYGKKIYACLKDEPIMADITDAESVQSYWSKQGYGVNTDYGWQPVIPLLDAVKKEYMNKQ